MGDGGRGDNRTRALEHLLRKLEPTVVRSNLIRAGLFLAGWELLKAEVQEKVRDFYLVGFDENGFTYSDDYERRVLAKHKSAFEASLLWLVEAQALTEDEAESVRGLRSYRNEIAHELPQMLVGPGHDVDVGRLRQVRDLLAKLGRFWGRIVVDTDPDFEGEAVADEGIVSGVSLLMDMLVSIAEEPEGPGAGG